MVLLYYKKRICDSCGFKFSLCKEIIILFALFCTSIFYPEKRWIFQDQKSFVLFLILYSIKLKEKQPMRLFFKILLTALAVSILLCPIGFKIWWPNDFNWGIGFLANILTACFATLASILWSSSIERSKSVRAWLPFAEASLEGVYTIEATMREGLHKMNDKGSLCKLVVENLKEDTPSVIVELTKQHCEQCKQTLNHVLRTVQSSENNWFRFINKSCEAGECEEIYDQLKKIRNNLGLSEGNNVMD